MIHISLDLETWGKRPGFDLRSIGAVVFDPATGYVADPNNGGDDFARSFYRATDNPIVEPNFAYIGQPVREYALARDPDTEQWWSEQSAEAQAAFENPVDLRDALVALSDWFDHMTQHIRPVDTPLYKVDIVRLWTHGAAFDPGILEAAYHAVGLPYPLHYRAPRDTRTTFDNAGIFDHSAHLAAHPGPMGILHQALDDSICQARAICEADRTIRGWAGAYLLQYPEAPHNG